MPAQALFGTSVAFGFIAWGIVAAQYFWPLLRAQATAISLPLLHSAVGIPLVWGYSTFGAGRSSLRLLSRQCFRVSAGYVAKPRTSFRISLRARPIWYLHELGVMKASTTSIVW
jgi:hypothetical protein